METRLQVLDSNLEARGLGHKTHPVKNNKNLLIMHKINLDVLNKIVYNNIFYYAVRGGGYLMKKGERGALKPPPYISTELLHPVPDPKSGKGLNSCSERHKRLENS